MKGAMILCEKLKDIISGVFLSLLGIAMFITTNGIKSICGETTDVGSAFMPKIGAVLLTVFGIAVFIGGISKYLSMENTAVKTDTPETSVEKSRKMRSILLTLALIGAYIFLMNLLGFIIASILYLFFQILLLAPVEKRNYFYFAVIAFTSSVGIYYLFYKAFSMMLPTGILG
jgi:putative tricarboxylic transport membrane protein